MTVYHSLRFDLLRFDLLCIPLAMFLLSVNGRTGRVDTNALAAQEIVTGHVNTTFVSTLLSQDPVLETKSRNQTECLALLNRLKERDALFDNRTVQLEQCWTERVSPQGQIASSQFNARRFGQPVPVTPPKEEIPDDFNQAHRVRYALTTRQNEVTLERVAELETMLHPQYTALSNKGSRWSTVGGVEQVYSPEIKRLHRLGPPSVDGILAANQCQFEWCCGFGIGKRLQSIDSVEVKERFVLLKGKAQLFGCDDASVELKIDAEDIIRRLVIFVPAKQGAGGNKYVVETIGTVRSEGNGLSMAKTGHFRRIIQLPNKDDQVYQEFTNVFVSVSDKLTNKQYVERTQIVPMTGTEKTE